MDSLPLELYDYIFEHLHLFDVARLRRVNKRLRSIVQQYRLNEVRIHDWRPRYSIYYGFPVEQLNSRRHLSYFVYRELTGISNAYQRFFWGRTDGLIKNSLASKNFFLTPLFNVNYLESLACYCGKDNVQLEDINKLTNLKRLEVQFSDPLINCTLTLPNLRTLYLTEPNSNLYLSESIIDSMKGPPRLKIVVDTPKCESLRIYKQRKPVQFVHPNSVRFLYLEFYDEDIQMFKNVEYLRVSYWSVSDEERFYSAYPRLKTLRIVSSKAVSSIKRLFQLKKRVGMRQLEIFFFGVHLSSGTEFDEYASPSDSFPHDGNAMPALMDNFEKLEDNLTFVYDIFFSQKVAEKFELNARRFPRIFNSIIPHVQSSTKIEQPELFFRFCTCFDHEQFDLPIHNPRPELGLTIHHSGLDSEWFQQLAALKNLISLNIIEENKVNFSFTRELPLLNNIETNQDIDLKEEIRFVERQNFRVRMRVGGYGVGVTQNLKKNFGLTYFLTRSEGQTSKETVLKGNHFEVLLELLEQIRNGETPETIEQKMKRREFTESFNSCSLS